eukprot:scpid2031/ scgid34571/ 
MEARSDRGKAATWSRSQRTAGEPASQASPAETHSTASRQCQDRLQRNKIERKRQAERNRHQAEGIGPPDDEHPVRVRRHDCTFTRDSGGNIVAPSQTVPLPDGETHEIEIQRQGRHKRLASHAAPPWETPSPGMDTWKKPSPGINRTNKKHDIDALPMFANYGRQPQAVEFDLHAAERAEREKNCEELTAWLAKRKELNHQLDTFANTATFIESNPPEYRTPLDGRVLENLHRRRSSATRRLPAGQPDRVDTKLQALDATWEEMDEDALEQERRGKKRRQGRAILRSMEAINEQLCRHKYRIVALFKRMDEHQKGRLHRNDIKRLFGFRAFRVDPEAVDLFLDQLDKDGSGWIRYAEIVPLDDTPWQDIPLAEHWPDFLSPSTHALLSPSDLRNPRPLWGSSPSSKPGSGETVFGKRTLLPSKQVPLSVIEEAKLQARVEAAPRAPAEVQRLRNAYQEQVRQEYEKVVEVCRHNGLTLNEDLLKLLLVPFGDRPVMECIQSLRQPGGTQDLLSRDALKQKVNDHLRSLGLLTTKKVVQKRKDVFDSRDAYDDDHQKLPPKLMRLSTGKAVVGPKVDCWMTLEEYTNFANGMKTRFRRPAESKVDATVTDKMSPFWPGFMLDRLRLWMPLITDKASAQYHEPLASGGNSYTAGSIFSRTHRQPSDVKTGAEYVAKASWPVNRGGHVQIGSVDDKLKSCYL